MESFFGRFKVENRSLILDAESLEELKPIVQKRIRPRRPATMAIIQDFYHEG